MYNKMAQKGKGTGSHQSSFNVVGQSLSTPGRGEPEGQREDGAWASQPNTPKDGFEMVEQVMAVNRSLVEQIDTLRLRLQVDSKHHEATRDAMAQETHDKLCLKDSQVSELKDELRSKEFTVKSLADENQKKRQEIQSMQHTINALRQDVEVSKHYIEDIQQNLNLLQEDKEKLESGAAYREKEDLIRRLTKELADMRTNLAKLERELNKAKEVISTQGSKLRLLDHEKHNLHVKFKDELQRATQTMKHEVEKMREVMKGQWEEMRSLRHQNENMRTDIREIKDLLLADATAEPQSPMYNMGALKPSLPALSRNSKRIIPGKKKPLG